jgi:hypothetical protein
MSKVDEPCSKDLSDRLCTDNIVNEFNSNELLFAKMWERKETAPRLRTDCVNIVSETVPKLYKNNKYFVYWPLLLEEVNATQTKISKHTKFT